MRDQVFVNIKMYLYWVTHFHFVPILSNKRTK